jgi:hypothetical protein
VAGPHSLSGRGRGALSGKYRVEQEIPGLAMLKEQLFHTPAQFGRLATGKVEKSGPLLRPQIEHFAKQLLRGLLQISHYVVWQERTCGRDKSNKAGPRAMGSRLQSTGCYHFQNSRYLDPAADFFTAPWRQHSDLPSESQN